jgi:hypothetical protein
VWGVVFCAEAVLRVVLSYNVSTGVMVTVNAVLPLVVIGGLVAWTTAYGRRRQARAAASGHGGVGPGRPAGSGQDVSQGQGSAEAGTPPAPSSSR